MAAQGGPQPSPAEAILLETLASLKNQERLHLWNGAKLDNFQKSSESFLAFIRRFQDHLNRSGVTDQRVGITGIASSAAMMIITPSSTARIRCSL